MSQKLPKKVFVSGCYDILHAGHIAFFRQARSLGDSLIVCFANTEVLGLAKKRKPSLPDDHKMIVLSELSCVDMVVSSSDIDAVFDFVTHIDTLQPDILVVTDDDQNIDRKRAFCQERDMEFVVVPKDSLAPQLSTSSIIDSIRKG